MKHTYKIMGNMGLPVAGTITVIKEDGIEGERSRFHLKIFENKNNLPAFVSDLKVYGQSGPNHSAGVGARLSHHLNYCLRVQLATICKVPVYDPILHRQLFDVEIENFIGSSCALSDLPAVQSMINIIIDLPDDTYTDVTSPQVVLFLFEQHKWKKTGKNTNEVEEQEQQMQHEVEKPAQKQNEKEKQRADKDDEEMTLADQTSGV